jgi:hypothetical protein
VRAGEGVVSVADLGATVMLSGAVLALLAWAGVITAREAGMACFAVGVAGGVAAWRFATPWPDPPAPVVDAPAAPPPAPPRYVANTLLLLRPAQVDLGEGIVVVPVPRAGAVLVQLQMDCTFAQVLATRADVREGFGLAVAAKVLPNMPVDADGDPAEIH